MPRVVLTLKYDIGEYDAEDLAGRMPIAFHWEETFAQMDVLPCDMVINGVDYIGD